MTEGDITKLKKDAKVKHPTHGVVEFVRWSERNPLYGTFRDDKGKFFMLHAEALQKCERVV